MRPKFRQITPTDHFTVHRAYLPVYELLFEGLRSTLKPVIEIGNYMGGGLLMYADYFHQAQIIGIDVLPIPDLQHDRITLYRRNACEDPSWLARAGGYSVIIDDASHRLEDQLYVVTHYSHLLAEEGIMVIEDVMKEDTLHELTRAVPPGFACMPIDLRFVNDHYDDFLFCVFRQT